jgi:hypothetical protein
MAIITDPVTSDISAISTFGTALASMLQSTLPSSQQRLEAFRVRYPILYLKVRHRIENRIYSYLKANFNPVSEAAIVDEVKWDSGDLPQAEQDNLVVVLSLRFNLATK